MNKIVLTMTTLSIMLLLVGGVFAIETNGIEDPAIDTNNLETLVRAYSISLKDATQKTADGSARFDAIVKDLHSGNEKKLYTYTLKFSSEQSMAVLFEEIDSSFTGTPEEITFTMAGGESKTIGLKVKAKQEGLNTFKLTLTSKDSSYTPSAVGTLEYNNENKPTPSPTRNTVDIEISPEKQKTETGEATYEVSVKNIKMCLEYMGNPCFEEETRYELVFNSPQKIKGEFSENALALKPGESKTVKLTVSADAKGTFLFSVGAIGKDSKGWTRGILYYQDNGIDYPKQSPFFFGQGFALSNNKNQGAFVELNIFREDDELKGKMTLGKKAFSISGFVNVPEENSLFFTIYEINTKEPTGTFNGKLTKYDDFDLLEGDLSFAHEDWSISDWKLTAISKRERVFKIIDPSEEQVTETTQIQDVVTITESSEEKEKPKKEVYIRPTKITKSKILGIIPNPWGKKVLEVEIVKDGEVVKKQIKEFDKTTIEDYSIEVGSLKDEKEIEISVQES